MAVGAGAVKAAIYHNYLKQNADNQFPDQCCEGDVLVAASPSGFGVPLYLKSDGTYAVANATDASAMPCSALVVDEGVLRRGRIRNDAWNFTPGKLVYVSTTGELTQTAPSTTGNVLQIIGYAETAGVLCFEPNFSVVTV